jgi:hypothetical protein
MQVYEFLLDIKNHIIMKKEFMCEHDHVRFNKCWGELAECIL